MQTKEQVLKQVLTSAWRTADLGRIISSRMWKKIMLEKLKRQLDGQALKREGLGG